VNSLKVAADEAKDLRELIFDIGQGNGHGRSLRSFPMQALSAGGPMRPAVPSKSDKVHQRLFIFGSTKIAPETLREPIVHKCHNRVAFCAF